MSDTDGVDETGTDADLTTVEGLALVIREEAPGEHQRLNEIGVFNGTFCPRCGAVRRMRLVSLFWEDRWAPGRSKAPVALGAGDIGIASYSAEDDPAPALYVAICVQCDHQLALLVHKGAAGVEVVALPEAYGGVTTPSTPPEVAYYLDQAARSQAVGAFTAAVAMYRAALEHLLLKHGYDQHMLGPKIGALIDDDNPPAWRDQLDPEYLRVIKDLGNAAIHTNDGGITTQHAFEAKLVREVETLFAELLDLIYEQPAQKISRLAALRRLSESFKR